MVNKGRVLVTGGAGFIGSHTADLLLDKGYEVRILDNLSRFDDGKWPEYLNKKFEKIKGDVRNKKDWEKALNNVDYVIHLAAMMDFHLQFSKFFEINAVGTANLYETIVKRKYPIQKVVVASSQFVYGYGIWKCKLHGLIHSPERKEFDFKNGIWDPVCSKCGNILVYQKNKESHFDPPNQYAISKLTQELIAFKLGKIHNIPSTALRYSIVHGSRQSVSSLYSGALRVFVLQMLNQKKIFLFEDGLTMRDFVSVKDVARANVLVMENEKSNFESYNVGGGVAYTISDLAKIVAKKLGKKIETEYGSYRLGDMRHAFSDISKIRKLGWKPVFNAEDNVSEFINWAMTQKNNTSSVESAFNKMRSDGYLKRA